jgi:3-phosphoshikimate 1-carboxyvinyltransferase
MADLTPLRRFLPLLGARLAHTMPGSKGLPASIEASGAIPDRLDVPEEFGEDAALALVCAAATWGRPVTLNLARLPAGVTGAALGRVTPLFTLFGVDARMRGPLFTVTPPGTADDAGLAVPEYTPDLDPVLSAYILALPALAGGAAALSGVWPSRLPEAGQAEDILKSAGLALNATDTGIGTRAGKQAGPRPATPPYASLAPLCHTLAALAALRDGSAPAPAMDDAASRDIAESFYAALGIALREDGTLSPAPGAAPTSAPMPMESRTGASAAPFAWTSPDIWWGLAFALAGYLRPRLRLANPGLVTDTAPGFWQLYNALPAPTPDKPVPKPQESPAPRRRIRTS